MSPAQTAALLALCAAYDSRRIGESDVAAWHEVLAEVPALEARAAVVAHYSRSTDRVMPAHVLAEVRRVRALRLQPSDELPDADPDDVPAWLAALREGRVRRADGLVERPVRALLAGMPERRP